MAEDFSDKTEEPTPKKLADARQKGFVAKSQDMTIGVLLFLSLILVYLISGHMYASVEHISLNILENLNTPFDQVETVVFWLRIGLWQILLILLPLIVGVFVVGFIVNLAQVGLVFSFYTLIPKWQRINFFYSPNLERIFSWRAMLRMTFGLVRINLSFFIAWLMIGFDMPVITRMGGVDTMTVLIYIQRKLVQVGLVTAFTYILIAIVDLFYQKWRFKREMKMSRRELKDEIKQLEGDLVVKNKIKAAMRSLVYDKLQKIIPTADVIISDAGRYAVALSYDPKQMKTPIVVCKGLGKKSDAMLRAAKKYKVSVVENTELARSLFRNLNEDSPIKPEHYSEVAAALVFLKINEP